MRTLQVLVGDMVYPQFPYPSYLTRTDVLIIIISDKILEVHIMDDEKEEYREKIIETVNNIKDIKILIYLDTFIKEIIKAEE